MTSPRSAQDASRLPPLPLTLGLAGLLPQAAVVAILAFGSDAWHFAALSIGYAYPALILSFVGGMWWGLAASRTNEAPAWLWIAAVAPSLIALASAVPWAIGATWPGPSLAVLAIFLLISLLLDRRLVRIGIAPIWWMSVRTPLSIGLALLTLAAAVMG